MAAWRDPIVEEVRRVRREIEVVAIRDKHGEVQVAGGSRASQYQRLSATGQHQTDRARQAAGKAP